MGRADFWQLVGAQDAFGVHFLRVMLRCLAIQLNRVDQNVLQLREEMKLRRSQGL